MTIMIKILHRWPMTASFYAALVMAATAVRIAGGR